jgi:hypothetical protein
MYVVMLTVRRRPKIHVLSSIALLVTAGHQTEKKLSLLPHTFAYQPCWCYGPQELELIVWKKCPIVQFSCQFLWRLVSRFNGEKMRTDTHMVSGNKRGCREYKVYVFITRNYYVNLFFYKQRSLLHDSATCCDRLQGGVLWTIYHIERQNNLRTKKLSFQEKVEICFTYIVFF